MLHHSVAQIHMPTVESRLCRSECQTEFACHFFDWELTDVVHLNGNPEQRGNAVQLTPQMLVDLSLAYIAFRRFANR